MCSRGKPAIWEGRIFHNLPVRKCKRLSRAAAYLPMIDLGKNLEERQWKKKRKRRKDKLIFPSQEHVFSPTYNICHKIRGGEKFYLN